MTIVLVARQLSGISLGLQVRRMALQTVLSMLAFALDIRQAVMA